MVKYPLAVILVMAASVSQAQVKVVDLQPANSSMPPPLTPVMAREGSDSARPAPANQTVEMYFQLQTLQQEVQELRGIVEEQGHELKRLKQQRMDDYLDLDRRISQLSQQGSGSSTLADTDEPIAGDVLAGKGELADYRAAIDLVLKEQDYDRGIVALEKHLAEYPSGRYAGNAQYWLGQIYLLKSQLEQSRQWFAAMLKDHPDHQKAPEAKFKLGKVYDLLGDKAQAKALMEEVAASNSNAAGLAREYLKQNFSS